MAIRTYNTAAWALASSLGVLSGLGGIRHGVGEIQQGKIEPMSFIIDSWTQGPLASNMGGEPAFTILPNLLLTGIVTSVVAVLVIIWSIAFLNRKHAGLILLLLCVTLFITGGGFGPPIIGILAGIAGLGIRAKYTCWNAHIPKNLSRLFAKAWPIVFTITLINGAFLFIASLVLVCIFNLNNPDVFVMSFYLAILLSLLSTVSGIAYDLQHKQQETAI